MDSISVSIEILKQRSELLQRLRQFFLEQDFVEVETPLLAEEVIPELHIEPVEVVQGGKKRWLQASPELHMKRLVAAGMEAIFQITRSFRGYEVGKLHSPEFTMVEWYRVGDDMQAGMELLDQLCQKVVGTKTATRTTYAQAFQQHVGLCPHRSSAEALSQRAAELSVAIPEGLEPAQKDEWLNLLLAKVVEPQLGREAPELLYGYPASQAALAKTAKREGQLVAERFELYWQGVELANGYHELTDAEELRSRLMQVNLERANDGRDDLPMPESLLAAMEAGLSDCSGCALGFDRLVMLALGKSELAQVRAFTE